MYDLKEWFLMPSVNAKKLVYDPKTLAMVVYGRETHHLEGIHVEDKTKVIAHHYDTGKTMVFGKTDKGFPWDLKGYDDLNIYDTATENGWKSDKDYKMQADKIAMCPRYWNGEPHIYRSSPHVHYNVIQGCKQVGQGDVGPAFFSLEGPFMMDHEGDVGIINTILISYYWSDGKNREQLFLTDPSSARPVGWVKWTHANRINLDNSTYVDYKTDQTAIHNKIVLGSVKPVSTCFQIP
jgi:hypothetical protein